MRSADGIDQAHHGRGSRDFLLVRHPETVANATGRHVARGDSPYSEVGASQARALPSALASWNPDRIVSSPQRRALTPARATHALLARDGRPVTLRVDPGLVEFDVGLVEGLTTDEAEARGLTSADDWLDAATVPYAGGEQIGAFVSRCVHTWSHIRAASGRTLVVSHRGVIACVIVHALGLSSKLHWDYCLSPAHAAHMRLTGDQAELVAFDVLPVADDGATMPSNP